MQISAEEALADLQGIVLSGYGHLGHAVFLFLRIVDGKLAKTWLRRIIPATTTAKPWPEEPDGTKRKPANALHIALTYKGLEMLALPRECLLSFPREFAEGIAARADVLGDTGDSAPENWQVGGPNSDEVHALLMLHAADHATAERLLEEHRGLLRIGNGSLREVTAERGRRLAGSMEHFGFHDGISQPEIEGVARHRKGDLPPVKPGEFVLGYLNEYNVFPPSPLVHTANDPAGILPRFPNGALPDCRDFGRHGTYLVYRKLAQDVAGFWRFIGTNADNEPGRTRWLAAKFIGRWPSGAPLTLATDQDDPAARNENRFTYLPRDAEGHGCPIGSHIRRCNPRDSRLNDTPEESLRTSTRHRIVRRGIPYGEPLFDAQEIQDGKAPVDLRDDGNPRGLQFLCINASIARQFEFVQQTWANNPSFNALYENKDPIIGDNDGSGCMIIPRHPIRQRIARVPRFVTVKGGGYFFLPSITALRYLENQ